MKTLIGIVTILLIATTGRTIAQIALPTFLEGTWKMENRDLYEHWDILGDGSMRGYSYRIMNGEEVTTEYLEISLRGEQVVYTAIVPDQNEGKPIDFILLQHYFKNMTGTWTASPADSSFISRLEYKKGEEQFFVAVGNTLLSKTGDLFAQYEGVYVYNPVEKQVTFITITKSEIHIGFGVILTLLSCGGRNPSIDLDKYKISEDIREMLNVYRMEINLHGLMSEFKYLDDSPEFFWNPPGYQSTLAYDSVRAEVQRNAMQFPSVQFRWDTLQIFPLTPDIANFSGIARGEMTDTSGLKTKVSLLESGTVIKRKDGWKILNGHTSILNEPTEHISEINEGQTMKRVTGIGGIFFKSKNPARLNEWYRTHLGLDTDRYGTNFEWRQGADPSQKGFSQWSPFSETTKYFEPSTRDFMINYRVGNLEALVEELKREGVTILTPKMLFPLSQIPKNSVIGGKSKKL